MVAEFMENHMSACSRHDRCIQVSRQGPTPPIPPLSPQSILRRASSGTLRPRHDLKSARLASNRVRHGSKERGAPRRRSNLWRTLISTIILVVLTLAFGPVASSADSPPSTSPSTSPVIPAQVRAVYRLADLGTNVETFCLTLVENAGIELANESGALHQQLDAMQRTRWLSAIQTACQEDHARERHLAAFAVGYDAENARAVTRWYTSDTGRHMLEIEIEAAQTDWDAEISPFIDRITKSPVPVERVKLAERINAGSHAIEDTAMLQAGIASILTYGARALQPAGERTSRKGVDEQIEMIRQQIAYQMRAQQSVIFMFMYQDASDAELLAFAEFAESDAAQWLFASHRMAMLQLISEVREQVEAQLAN